MNRACDTTGYKPPLLVSGNIKANGAEIRLVLSDSDETCFVSLLTGISTHRIADSMTPVTGSWGVSREERPLVTVGVMIVLEHIPLKCVCD